MSATSVDLSTSPNPLTEPNGDFIITVDPGDAANYTVTGAIQTGTANQPALQPFADQQKQALRDAYITFGNAAEFADGLAFGR